VTPQATILYGDAWELGVDAGTAVYRLHRDQPSYWGLRDYGHPDQFV
jgi:hypothetical protein